jgi:DinB superfamily
VVNCFKINNKMEDLISTIKKELELSFSEVDKYFDCHYNLLIYKPLSNSWSIKEIVEHISLTNYYLLILVKKGVEKSLVKSKQLNIRFGWENYIFDWNKLNAIGQHKSFLWNRPNHMEPTNQVELSEVRQKIKNQLNDCVELLLQIKNGEGVLHKTLMSVNDLGKIDVYHYIYFIVQHNKRHLEQIYKIVKETK